MNRKDYELVARVIREDVETLVARQHFARVFADAFKREDANFNREKFLQRALGKRDAQSAS